MSERYYEVDIKEAMSSGPMSDDFHTIIFEYLYGRREKPIELIQSGIQYANYKIKKINNDISSLGLCCFGEKRIKKTKLIAEKTKWKAHVSVFNEILELRSNLDIVGVATLLEKYEALTQVGLN